MRCTFVNNGTQRTFRANNMVPHWNRDKIVTEFEVHGELALWAMETGDEKTTYLLNSQGEVMDAKSIKNYIRFLRDQK